MISYKTNKLRTASFPHKPLNAQQSDQSLFTELKAMRMLRELYILAMFLTIAHAQSVTCTQLFAGKLTNQN